MNTRDETMPYTLVGGPMDGLEVDTRESNTELLPAPHHFHRIGLEFRPVLYVKQADGRYHYKCDLPDADGNYFP